MAFDAVLDTASKERYRPAPMMSSHVRLAPIEQIGAAADPRPLADLSSTSGLES